MEIYLIGYFFMLGFLLQADRESEKAFTGFTGNIKLAFCCLIWPVAFGSLVAEWLDKK